MLTVGDQRLDLVAGSGHPVLLVLAIVTVFPLGLRISWPFYGLTLLYTASLLLTIARQAEFG